MHEFDSTFLMKSETLYGLFLSQRAYERAGCGKQPKRGDPLWSCVPQPIKCMCFSRALTL